MLLKIRVKYIFFLFHFFLFFIMITAVIGSRSFSDFALLSRVCRSLGVSSVVSGGASGADSLAARFASSSGLPLRVFRPDYERFGRRAPLVRNWQIVRSGSQVVAFWDGSSRGCAHALSCARRLDIPCSVVRF
ncbi:MAG: DUF2493 domain-containing protein [Bacteroidetes bacterium]|nr:DUF2493 domain-containing protein [Bacteroidota bacterium]